MFFSKFILMTKGPLSHVWISAHWKRKLTKHQVNSTDINFSANAILDPATPLALRLSGQLLLGLVRIYSRKVRYLHEDASASLSKMKMVFVRGNVNLQQENTVASNAAITISDNYSEAIEYAVPDDHDLDGILESEAMAEAMSTMQNSQSLSVARAADITLAAKDAGYADLHFSGMDDSLLNLEALDGGDMGDLLGEEDAIDFGQGDSLEVEVARDAGDSKLEDFDFDLPGAGELDMTAGEGAKNASLQQSKLDFEGMDSGAFDMDGNNALDETSMMMDDGSMMGAPQTPAKGSQVSLPPASDFAEPTPVAQRKKPKRKREERRDLKTELAGKDISAGLKDTSDIVGQRNVLPLTKRQKAARDAQDNDELNALLTAPCFASGALSHKLRELYHKTATTDIPDLPVREVDELAEEEGKAAQAQAAQDKDQSALDFPDLDFGDFSFAGMDDTGVSMDGSVMVPGAEEQGQEGAQLDEEQAAAHGEEAQEDRMNEEDGEGLAEDDDSRQGQDAHWERTEKLYTVLKREMKSKDTLNVQNMLNGTRRRDAAGIFYQLLVLKSHSFVDVQQEHAYGDIELSKGEQFGRPLQEARQVAAAH